MACNYLNGDCKCYRDESSAYDVNISMHCVKNLVYNNQNSDTKGANGEMVLVNADSVLRVEPCTSNTCS